MNAPLRALWRHAAPVALAALVATAPERSRAAPRAGDAAEPARPRRVLRVCADPNNLPFSNDRRQGLENRMAALLAKELDAVVEYTWWAQGRGFFRNTLKAGLCDVVMGVPKQIEFVDTTDVVYRSTYVFVAQKRRGLRVESLDDPALAKLRIGVHVIGDDYTNTPPVHALGARGLIDNLVGYRINGDYAEPNPPARLVEAVAAGTVDLAVVWGPIAGYFSKRQALPLEVRPLLAAQGPLEPPMSYDIAFGLRRGEPQFKQELNDFLARRRPALVKILREYGVPLEGEHR